MSRASHPNRAENRKATALARLEASKSLTPEQRLAKLDAAGLRAVKERKKLERAIEKAKADKNGKEKSKPAKESKA